ncbi:MAG: helix-turn-helix domain-containing protein [Firmicutes bacterium]|nr:helix-turn-helix domain-containing protein [Bacillota bacterium]
MDDNLRIISTKEELKIFSDPYRMKIIRTFLKSEKPLTVKGCADLMGEVPANVHYHVKKLLKINILELDHIEVINGINAKYYKLPKSSFTISLTDTDDIDLYQRLTQVHNLVSRVIDDFKEDFMKSSAYEMEHKEKKNSEVGMIAANPIYLTEEEFNQISKMLSDIARNYKKDDEHKKYYSFIGGLARKEE